MMVLVCMMEEHLTERLVENVWSAAEEQIGYVSDQKKESM